MSSKLSAVLALLVSTLICESACGSEASSFYSSHAITAPTSTDRTGQDIVSVDVSAVPSWDEIGSSNNIVRYVWIGPLNSVNGVGFDVVIQTIVPSSWRDDMGIRVTNTANDPGAGFIIVPGSLDGPGGPTAYSSEGIIKLAPLAIPNVQARLDGLIRLEFLEKIDDMIDEIDGQWVSGLIHLQTTGPIPVPATGPTAITALVGWIGLRRSRV